jgi:altronate hydrolase
MNSIPSDLIIQLHPLDNVAIAKSALTPGKLLSLGNKSTKVLQAIPIGHKIALEEIPAGTPVRRYGQAIGFASQPIHPGEHVHVHNVSIEAFERHSQLPQEVILPQILPVEKQCTFQGYLRPDGRVGTRNYIAVISTVNCSASVTRQIAGYFTPDRLKDYPNVDGVIALTGSYGCGIDIGGENYNLLQRTLAGMACHPNVAGYLFVGLGCETNQASALMESCHCEPCPEERGDSEAISQSDHCHCEACPEERGTILGEAISRESIPEDTVVTPTESRLPRQTEPRLLRFARNDNEKTVRNEPAARNDKILVIQELGGVRKTVAAGIAAIEQMLPIANQAQRTSQPISKLILAVQCGGSDSWSGVTANPVVGLVADRLVQQGGAVVLAETPEIYGAEHLLTRRALNAQVAEKLLSQVRWWEDHTQRLGTALDTNRSPGNAAGGLTTIYEKALGAVAKGGSTPLMAVYEYAEQVTDSGLVFMNSPGNDWISVTGQVAGGCNLVVFTTGRGSVFGFKPAPSIKISTHSAMYQRLEDDMDINAGRVLEGSSLDEVAEELFERMISVASGLPSKSEVQGVGEAEFQPWFLGGVL